MMIKITKQSQHKQIQKLLFEQSYQWLSSSYEYMYYSFVDNFYYIVNEETKKISFVKDISDESHYTWNFNGGKDVIDGNQILRKSKLDRILEK